MFSKAPAMELYLPLNNLAKRLLTGLVLVVIIVGAIMTGPVGFLLLLLLINLLALLEFYRLFHSAEIVPQKWGGVALSTLLFLILYGVLSRWVEWHFLLAAIPMAFALVVRELYRKSLYPFHNLAFTFWGLTWISVPLLLFLATAFLPFHQWHYRMPLVLGYFFILWAADSGAYFVGTAFGRHKLFERISPGKTWEGSVGGAVAAYGVAFMAARYFTEWSTTDWMVITALVLVTGTYGDFTKSMMKRSLHIKDSGTILPGHGGILDRFDTLIGSTPFVFLYLLLFTHA